MNNNRPVTVDNSRFRRRTTHAPRLKPVTPAMLDALRLLSPDGAFARRVFASTSGRHRYGHPRWLVGDSAVRDQIIGGLVDRKLARFTRAENGEGRAVITEAGRNVLAGKGQAIEVYLNTRGCKPMKPKTGRALARVFKEIYKRYSKGQE